ncbi:Transcription initiation factor TFIID subunit 7 [Komagataella phaffii CBS 7435]|uniref:TFIID subunit (67 kDa), involved in RNA polymerase II transcription initiation n=2 Tax=Komagataella phaffii TaxID=460519 RepID=C4R9B7_KOMPG|nr:TFIID subunit (67 kDa), involved in RNA polymerase II transcription initiation [Komagataella phaffii GS115]AOA65175.1 GQ67_05303T0 [Komagataella phaffii]CAH2450425.1 Transcription initiation factor TFIID subunit 7 [Komagataella phaffii CBS 7435]AOA69670.1 GQ68_05310T0 [Komagataella phaffii GS115]CAY72192.1 TFIID subunit (67 kDa), involved in RNA polymerase II transcription initiation [Komagataella phaffii GS115]CCA40196.1 Transcription initiation factor TFIID subunit 7 [Komagataella phaffii
MIKLKLHTDKKQNTVERRPKIKVKPPINKPESTVIPRIRVKPTRIAGDGYDSEDPDREDDPTTEEAIVMRIVPNDYSLEYVKKCVEQGDFSEISLQWKDKRRAVLRLKDRLYGAKLVDLPTMVEIHKTIDRKNIFKTMDVSQILLVIKELKYESEYLDIQLTASETFDDGLTPPLRGVKKRFDKRMTSKVFQIIEEQVDELFRLDEEAEASKYELVDTEAGTIPSFDADASTPNTKEFTVRGHLDVEDNEDLELELEQAFQQQSDTPLNPQQRSKGGRKTNDSDAHVRFYEQEEEDDEDEETFELKRVCSAEAKVEEGEEEAEEETEETEDDEDDDDEEVVGGKEIISGQRAGIDERLTHTQIIKEEIEELQATIGLKQSDFNKASNPIMKNRISDVIGRLKAELETKLRQVEMEQKEQQNNSNVTSHNIYQQRELDEDEDEDDDEDGDEDDDDDMEDLF